MNRHWAYMIFGLALTLIIGAGLTRYTLDWVGRPQARPAPTRPGPPDPAPSPRAEAGFGYQFLTPTVEGGVPTYDLVLQKVRRETGGGGWREACTVNGKLPEPLQVTEGQLTRFRVRNELAEPISIRWHGMALPAGQRDVAHPTRDPIAPGHTLVYEFTPDTRWYQTRFAGAQQATGLCDPLIVEPARPGEH